MAKWRYLTRDWPASWSQTLGSSVGHSCISLVYRPFVLLCHWRFSELHSFVALHDPGIFLFLPLICLMVSFLTRSRVRKTTVRSWIQHRRNGGGFKVSYRLILKRLQHVNTYSKITTPLSDNLKNEIKFMCNMNFFIYGLLLAMHRNPLLSVFLPTSLSSTYFCDCIALLSVKR